MIEAVIAGLLTTIAYALYDIRKELVRFRIHFDESSLSDYDRRNLIDLVGRMHDKLGEISLNTSREEVETDLFDDV